MKTRLTRSTAARLLWLTLASIAAGLSVAADDSFEVIRYKAPSGWAAADQSGAQKARVFTSPDSTAASQAVVLMMLAPAKDKLDLKADFAAVAKQLTENAKVVDSSELTVTQTRQGFEAIVQTMETQGADGKHVFVRIVSANVQNRMATFCYLATSSEMYEKHGGEVDELLKSVSFVTAGGGGAAAGGAVGGADVEALEKRKQALLKELAEIEAQQRQLRAGAPNSGSPASGGTPAAAAAAADEEAQLKVARERFTNDLEGRRKAHTVCGDILMLDGKPIPNVKECTVAVWGTTIAAIRTRYVLEVDRNGHFEQELPDGLYQLNPVCIVNLGGHATPVDLVAIDGKKSSVDQASSKGIVKDYRLAIDSLNPEIDPKDAKAYFGGMVRVMEMDGKISAQNPGSKVRVTFKPQGPSVDGVQHAPFSVDVDSRAVWVHEDIRRIPIGTYQVTTTLVGADNVEKGAIQCSFQYDRGFATSVELFWEGERSFAQFRNVPVIYLKY